VRPAVLLSDIGYRNREEGSCNVGWCRTYWNPKNKCTDYPRTCPCTVEGNKGVKPERKSGKGTRYTSSPER